MDKFVKSVIKETQGNVFCALLKLDGQYQPLELHTDHTDTSSSHITKRKLNSAFRSPLQTPETSQQTTTSQSTETNEEKEIPLCHTVTEPMSDETKLNNPLENTQKKMKII
jgi:hypothetical protein